MLFFLIFDEDGKQVFFSLRVLGNCLMLIYVYICIAWRLKYYFINLKLNFNMSSAPLNYFISFKERLYYSFQYFYASNQCHQETVLVVFFLLNCCFRVGWISTQNFLVNKMNTISALSQSAFITVVIALYQSVGYDIPGS